LTIKQKNDIINRLILNILTQGKKDLKIKRILAFALAVVCLIGITAPLGAEATEDTTEETAEEKREGPPLTWPVPGHYTVTQNYISAPGRFHNGIDILDKHITGATVLAAMGGTVNKLYKCTELHYSAHHACYGYGTCIMIDGDDGCSYVYAHLLGGSIPEDIKEGDRIEQGAKIGQVGCTGYSTAAHLHFVIAEDYDYLNKTVDPLTFTYLECPDNATKLTAAGIKYPIYLHKGDTFDIFGTVFSPKPILFLEAKVVDSAGKEMFGITVDREEEATVIDLNLYAEKLPFETLSDGDYEYTVYAYVDKGYSVNVTNAFTVGEGETSFASVGALTETHNCNEERVDRKFRWDDGAVTKEPTCFGYGVKTYTCRECGRKKTEDIPMVEHDFEEELTLDREATAEYVGYKSRHCKNCEASIDITEIPKLKSDDNDDAAGIDVVTPIFLFGICAALSLAALIVYVILRKKKANKENE